LLLKNGGLVKTVKFAAPRYVGDPINAIRIFNEKEADELIVLDISATPERREPAYDRIAELASECFMPMAYGGGITSVAQIERILKTGVEKVCLNTAALGNPSLVTAAAKAFGSQSIMVSLDVRCTLLGGYKIYSQGGQSATNREPITLARQMEEYGAGELFINSIDRDGTMAGYDVELMRKVVAAVSIPVVACGGAGTIQDFGAVVKQGHASAAAAGSLFVFHGKHRAVLISYPSERELQAVLA
jgi:cyclase